MHHCDLKDGNLLDADMKIEIGDFSFSKEISVGNNFDTLCGSPHYCGSQNLKQLNQQVL